MTSSAGVALRIITFFIVCLQFLVHNAHAQLADCGSDASTIFQECFMSTVSTVTSMCSETNIGTCSGFALPLTCNIAASTTNGRSCGAADNCICFAGSCVGTDTLECANPQVVGDPHLVGFSGQKFNVTGEDQGVYNLMHDGECNIINMRVTALPGMPVITYITGLGIVLCGVEGDKHTVEIMVNNPHDLKSSCPSENTCLADGALTVIIDGEKMTRPSKVSTGDGVEISAVNVPGECRPFGFEKYWISKQQESLVMEGRRLREAVSMSEWLLQDKLRTNPTECQSYVSDAEKNDSLFSYQSEHTSFQITSPRLSLRVNHGKIHQIAMRDPTDKFDLPDHVAYQMNVGFHGVVLGDDPRGLVGETVHPVVDVNGEPILKGIESIRADEEAYRVDCLLCSDFEQLLMP